MVLNSPTDFGGARKPLTPAEQRAQDLKAVQAILRGGLRPGARYVFDLADLLAAAREQEQAKVTAARREGAVQALRDAASYVHEDGPACGYRCDEQIEHTLTARADAIANQPTFADRLADPAEQFDLHSEVLGSICGVEIPLVSSTASADPPLPRTSVYVCTKPKPCPDHETPARGDQP